MKAIITSLLFLSKYGQSAGWNYDTNNGEDWATDYAMCGTSDQSPINIQSGKALHDASVCSKSLNWTLDWSVHSWKIGNNGHSIALQPVKRADWDPDLEDEASIETEDGLRYTTLSLNENSIARLPNYFLPEGSPNTEFCLHSFHFHWGRFDFEGSEHLLDDASYPLEVHFVHYSCRHTSLGTTLSGFATADDVNSKEAAGDDTHELAVVGIFFDVTDEDNPAFDAILSQATLDKIQYPTDSIYAEVIDGLYLQDIIPEGVFTDGYYAYEGSLTTPPCTNIVRWHVSNTRSYIGKAQMERFRALMSSSNVTMAPNYRDPQHNINQVYACMDPEVEVKEVNAIERAVVWVWAVIMAIAMCVMAGYCHWKVKRDAEAIDNSEPEALQRRRLQSRSSFGHAHDGLGSPVSPDGSGHHTTGHH